MASDYGNLGNVLQERGDLDGAEQMYRKSLDAAEKLSSPPLIAHAEEALVNLADARADGEGVG